MFDLNSRLCIDIGNNRIKLTEAAVSKRGLKLKKAVFFETPENSYSDGDIKNMIAIKEVLARTLKDNGFKSKNAIFTTSSTNIISREIVIPITKERNIDGLVRGEMEQYLPLTLDSYVLQYINLGPVMEGLKIRVVVFPKDMAKNYFDLCINLGLKPLALDIHSNGLEKFIKRIESVNDQAMENMNTILIDLGDNSFTFNGFDNKELKFSRVMDTGLERVVTYFKEGKGLSNTEMIKELNTISLDEEVNDVFDSDYAVLNESVMEWSRDIERLLNYYTNSLKENVNKVFLYGGGSRIRGIEKVLSEYLGVKVEKIKKVSFKDGELDSKNIDILLNNIGSSFREKR